MNLIFKCNYNKLFKPQDIKNTMEVGRAFVGDPNNYLENMAATFVDENGKPVEEERDGRYGRSYVINFSLPKKENFQNKKPSKILVPIDSFSPIYVPANEIPKH